MIPIALTIAGSDPSGGAGMQADLKTFHQFGCYGTAVVTLLTVQNTRRVDRVECLAPDLVVAQLRAVLEDFVPAAAKTGALGSAELVEALAEEARSFTFPLVVDPVLVSKHGRALAAGAAREAMARRLMPQADLVTPNLHEAEALTGRQVRTIEDMRDAAKALCDLGARAVLVKGGHLEGDAAVDILYSAGAWHEYRAPRIATRHTHGTGCTYSASITAGLAQGLSLHAAVAQAKNFITEAIRTNPGIGAGSGPVNHHAVVAREESR